jgi:hypothetical protein
LAINALPAAADDIDNIALLAQAQFKRVSEDLGSALSYKAVIPVEPLGTTGFDIGFEATATKLAHPDDLDAATSTGDAPDTLIVPKVHIHKGLPFGLDLGAFYASVPGSNIKLSGAEVRYAIFDGGIATPAVGLRAAYSKLSGVDDLDLKTTSLELAISKGFAMFTPYAGFGTVKTTSTPHNAPLLDEESFSQSKSFVGANINLTFLNLDVEFDKTGDASTTSLKFGWRF